MENVLETVLTESTEVETDAEETDFDHSFDLTENDLEESDEYSEGSEVVNTGTESENTVQDSPSNNAFAQMRTQNKEYSDKISQIDALVKSLGMKDIDEFLVKGKQAQIKKDAVSKGIPVEIAQELDEMRSLKNSIIAEREATAHEEKERKFVSTVQTFLDDNNLKGDAIDKLSQDLENDGIDINALMDMNPKAVNRILRSYVGTTYQKNLERKNTILNELPINQASKIDTKTLNQDIDSLAKKLSGKF